MKPEIHLFIIWQRGRYKEQEIFADMAEHFTMLKQYAITWTPELVSSNFTRFYGVNLPPKSGKEKECGNGEFLLCVVRDENPIYEERMTSRGPEVVNVNMFDAKDRYRSWTGGGHKVYGTNSEKETNHDLTLLIGKNVDDFLTDIKDEQREALRKDIEGAFGWKSISHLFYVLNNTVSYVALRGAENLDKEAHSDYEDTDILTTDYDNLWKIVNGEPLYDHVRPKSVVRINDSIYYLDIWDARKKYYDPIWMNNMIETAIDKGACRILTPENDFFCLLYHCLTNKGAIADKHLHRLEAYKKQFGIREDDWHKILVDWLSKHHYVIIEHLDPSNPFHISNPIINRYVYQYGKCIRIVSSCVHDVKTGKDIKWLCKVYQKENSFVKAGTPWVIDNEKSFLSRVGDGVHFPKLLASGGDDIEHWVEMSALPGQELFDGKWSIRMGNVRDYSLKIMELLETLYDNNVIHRDLAANNILVDKLGNVALIDFAFAIDFREDKDFVCPWNLGMGFAPPKMYSDFYNLAKIFEYRWERMPYVARFAKELKKIDWDHYQDSDFVHLQIAKVREALQRGFTLRDYVEYALGKYKVRKYIRHPKRLLRRVLPDMSPLKNFIKKLPGRVVRKTKKILHL